MNDRGQDYFDEKGYPELPVIPRISDMTIDPDTGTIPEALKPLGYVSAHISTWHMRGDPSDEGYTLHDGDNKTPRATPSQVQESCCFPRHTMSNYSSKITRFRR
jgi:arylsulfatase A-like enzyme